MNKHIRKVYTVGLFCLYFIFQTHAQLNAISYNERVLIDVLCDFNIDNSTISTIDSYHLYINNVAVASGNNANELSNVLDFPALNNVELNQPVELKLKVKTKSGKHTVYKKFVTYNAIYGVLLAFPTKEVL